MNTFYIVYKTINLITNNYYIGVHKQLGLDFDGYLGSGTRLSNAIIKYGKPNFRRETLFHFDSEMDAYNKEKELVDLELVKLEQCYNLTIGGRGGVFYEDSQGKRLKTLTERLLDTNPILKEIVLFHKGTDIKEMKLYELSDLIYGEHMLSTRYNRLILNAKNKKVLDKRSKYPGYSIEFKDKDLNSEYLNTKISKTKSLALMKYPELNISCKLVKEDNYIEGKFIDLLYEVYGTLSMNRRHRYLHRLNNSIPIKEGKYKGFIFERSTTKID